MNFVLISKRWVFIACLSMIGITTSTVAASSYTERTFYKFCQQAKCADGIEPASLVMDGQSNLYGTTSAGGIGFKKNNSPGYGTIFEFSPATSTFQTIYKFCSSDCSEGRNPHRVKLVIDTRGNLYGTTLYGGDPVAQGGTVFKLTNSKDGWHYEVIYTFCSRKNCKDGGLSEVGLAYSGQSSGTLYDGTSPLYGVDRLSVFKLTPKKSGKWKQKVLHSFCQEQDCTDGSQPEAPLYIDSAGDIFGTTELGGAADKGTVFELTPTGDGNYTLNVLYNFCAQQNCADGEEPVSSSPLVMDSAGNLLGTAGGGAKGDGVLFKLTPQGNGGWQYEVLANFSGKNGSGPVSLILGNDGSLFGTTYSGGTHDGGTVFQYADGTLQTIYDVCQNRKCSEGANPLGGVIQDTQGNLFGTNESGGLQAGRNLRAGTLFELVNDKPAHRAK